VGAAVSELLSTAPCSDFILFKQALGKEDELVEALRILEKKENLDWEYDEEADVLYISEIVLYPLEVAIGG